MKIERRPLSEVHPSPENPRHTAGAVPAVAESIRQFGFRNPIIVDADNIILAGHVRYAAAVKMRLAEVPVVRVDDLTPEQARMFRLADNQVASHATWNEELFREIEALDTGGFDLAALGFSDLELARLLAPDGTMGLTDPDAVPEPPAAPVSRPGEVYALGRHRLYCCPDDSALARWLVGATVDLLLSDIGEARVPVAGALRAADDALTPGAAFYLWYADGLSRWLHKDCADAGWAVRQGLIWPNDNATGGTGEYVRCHEKCLYGWKEGAAHRWFSDRAQTTVLDDIPSRSDGRKPVALFAYLLSNSCPPGGTVLDVFAGHGTTAIAAERLGMRARLVESSPALCDVIRHRWAAFVYGAGGDWKKHTPGVGPGA